MNNGKSEFKTKLVTSQRHDKAFEWTIEAPLVYNSALVGPLIVPKGFVYDKNSVPWYFRWLFPVSGRRSDYAATLHDWMYATELFPIEVCDAIYLETMLISKVNPLRAKMKYYAVRQFGISVWRTHTRVSLKEHRDLLDIDEIKRLLLIHGFESNAWNLWNLIENPKYAP